VRAEDDATALLPELRRAVWSVDADQPIVFADALEALVDASEARRVFARRILDAFAALALLLAGVGLYGVLAGSVGERAREMGVRAALGASRASLQGMVIRQGLSMAGLGVALGLVGTAVGTRVLASMLFGVSRVDPLTYASVLALVGLVATLACWLPAARAARSDPLVALRSD
jgi:ABC-type antimicrobial peptide transport system permease subunit